MVLARRYLVALLIALFCLPSRGAAWPQSQSDIAADDSVLFGTLPNGMRYAIMPNQTPPGQVSVRLRIGAGSLQESDAQQGLAHFIEHMAFRGSAHVPDYEAFRILERFGAAPGADSNAFTGQTETVFMVDLPKNSTDAIDTALMLMRETASELSFKEAVVDSERPVVLAEERLGDSPSARLDKQELAFVFKDQPVGNRLPIGSIDVLRKAQAADLRAFYDAYYRPERATLVIVGDVKPAAIEAKIKKTFSSWHGRGKAGSDPRFGPPLPRQREIKISTEAGAPPVATVEWTQPADPRPDNKAREKDELLTGLGIRVFEQRLRDVARGENPPFLAAHGVHQMIGKSARLTALSIGSTADGWKEALAGGLRILDTLLTDGVRQDELDRQVTQWRSLLVNEAAGAATRKTASLANELTSEIDRDDVFVTPASDLKLFDTLIGGIGPTQVDQVLRQTFAGNGPLVFVGGPTMVGSEEVAAVLDDAGKPSAERQKAAEVQTWPYNSFGPSGQVVERQDDAELGLTMLRFANGVRLTIKPTSFKQDQILIGVNLGHGREDLPSDRPTPLWAADAGAFVGGGLQALSQPDIDRLMAGKRIGARFSVGDNAFSLDGATRPQDFATELQMLAAYLIAPGWRPEAFESVRKRMITALPQWDSSPSAVFRRHAGQLLHEGDWRWQPPELEQLQTTKLADLRDFLDPVLAHAPIEMQIVGDVTVDQAVAAVADTIGALPKREAETNAPDASRRIAFPRDKDPVVLHHKGRADQGMVAAAWPSADFIADPQMPRNLRVLELVMTRRLTDEFRTRLGDSYSPGGDTMASPDFPGYGYMLALAETPEDKMAVFDDVLAAIVRDLRTSQISMDEFERARKPRLESLRKSLQTNEYWLGALRRAQTDPVALPIVRTVISDMERVTPADVRQAAETYLRDDRLWRLRITPESGTQQGERQGG